MEQPKTPSWALPGQSSSPIVRLLLREVKARRPPAVVLTVTLPRTRDEAFLDDDD